MKRYTFLTRASYAVFGASFVLAGLIALSAWLNTDVLTFWEFIGRGLIATCVINLGALVAAKLSEWAEIEWNRTKEKRLSDKIKRLNKKGA